MLDENDNIPEFLSYPSVFTVAENVSVGYIVYNMTALDRDSGVYGQVVYSLESIDSEDQAFLIDSHTVRPHYKPTFTCDSLGKFSNKLVFNL